MAKKPRGDLAHVKEPEAVLPGADDRHVAHHFDLAGVTQTFVRGKKIEGFIQYAKPARVLVAGALNGVDPSRVRLNVHAGANARVLSQDRGRTVLLIGFEVMMLQSDHSFLLGSL